MSDPRSETAAARRPGCIVLLVDESPALEARMAEGTRSKARSIATAVNSLLGRLAQGPPLDVALLGYRGRSDGAAVIGPRWSGPLEGRPFVSTTELAAAPLAVEQRVRRVPDPSRFGVARQETVPFPIWYSPVLGAAVAKPAAMEACRQALSAWLDSGGPVRYPPLVLSVIGDITPEDAIAASVRPLVEIPATAGPPLVFHAHLGGPARVPATLYPSTDTHLPPGAVRELYPCSSVLPELLSATLREVGVRVIRGARGLIYNAGMGDLIRFLSLANTYAAFAGRTATSPEKPQEVPDGLAIRPNVSHDTREPCARVATEDSNEDTPSHAHAAAPADAPTAETAALLVMLLDRSADQPGAARTTRAWTRLQQHANEILAELARRGRGRIDAALVCYGSNGQDGPDVQVGFAGTLAGPQSVRDTELAAGALREEEVSEQVSNGIGGLVSVTRHRPVFVDLEPTGVGSLRAALEAVARLVTDWRTENPAAPVGPIVLHLTRGRVEPGELAAGVEHLRQCGGPGPEPSLYHLVATESPHRSLAYPGDPSALDAELRVIWESTSPLLGRQGLAARRPSVSAQSRGLVVNGRFDLLLDAIDEALAGEPATASPADQ